MEITVMIPITACFRLARRYREAIKNSNLMLSGSAAQSR